MPVMPIKINCPGCGKSLKAPDSAAGKNAKCPECGTIVRLPDAPPLLSEGADEPLLDPEPLMDPEPLPEPSAAGRGGPQPVSEVDPYDFVQPPPRFATPPAVPAPPPSDLDPNEPRRPCPMCGEMIPVKALKCRFCGEVFDQALRNAPQLHNVAGTPTTTSGKAIAAMVCGIVGFPLGICCIGLAPGIVAVALGVQAKQEIKASRGTIGGEGMATTGIVLGAIDIGFALIVIVINAVVRMAGINP
jgi:predicted RNA-binding Zn-ribbon protein involved in translation (DUF1610 family)